MAESPVHAPTPRASLRPIAEAGKETALAEPGNVPVCGSLSALPGPRRPQPPFASARLAFQPRDTAEHVRETQIGAGNGMQREGKESHARLPSIHIHTQRHYRGMEWGGGGRRRQRFPGRLCAPHLIPQPKARQPGAGAAGKKGRRLSPAGLFLLRSSCSFMISCAQAAAAAKANWLLRQEEGRAGRGGGGEGRGG